MKMFVKIWKDPVGSKILASLIMIVFTAICGAISEKWTMDGIVVVLKTSLVVQNTLGVVDYLSREYYVG